MRGFTTAMACVACACAALAAPLCSAAEPAQAVRLTMDKLLKAVEANDYAAFVAEGNDAVKAGLTKQMLEGVSNQLAPRLKKGYDCAYLGELKQQGCQVYLWKLAYKDAGDDTLVRMTLKDGKVAGFLLQ